MPRRKMTNLEELNYSRIHWAKREVRRRLEANLPLEVVKSIRWTKGWDGQMDVPICAICMFNYEPVNVYWLGNAVTLGDGTISLSDDNLRDLMVPCPGKHVRKIKEAPYRLRGLRRGRPRPITKRPIRDGE